MEGQSTRQLKVARELQRYLAEIIRSRGMAAFGGAMLTVSEVRISPDLSIAKVYVSVFPSDKQKEVMETLEQLRIVPELDFYLDSSLDYAEHIEQLLKM